jgi:hypothetical protein
MAPVQKDVLAPGESTVVELIFNTKTVGRPPMNLNKHANVNSNDSLMARIPINFTGKIIPDTGSYATYTFGPSQMEFSPENRKMEIDLENLTDSLSLMLNPVGYIMDDFKIDIPRKGIAPGKSGKVVIEWKGSLPEYNTERSITFETGSKSSPRFSMAYNIKGSKGPRPIPQKAPQTKATPNQATISKSPSAAKGNSPVNTNPTTIPVKPDSTKQSTPWGKEVWPPK